MTPNIDCDVTVYSDSCRGGRTYMEDTFCVAFQPEVIVGEGDMPFVTSNQSSSSPREGGHWRRYVYAGIFDGHGGKEASQFARDHLLKNIVNQKEFWLNDDESILKAIREGFLATHYAMLREVDNWPKTTGGLPSTSGTTASICFVMHGKVYVGHVGDSRIVLGRRNRDTNMWVPINLTHDHKPDSPEEKERIAKAGGEVMCKSGVERVVWLRPKNGHRGPIRRSTNIDKIPFLAVARSLGDLWSYNPDLDTYVVSPDPDVKVITLDPNDDKCLILASDGLWNVLQNYESVRLIQELQEHDSLNCHLLKSLRDPKGIESKNPAQILVNYAIQKWKFGNLRADNTSAVTLILSPSSSSTPSSPTSSNKSTTTLPVISTINRLRYLPSIEPIVLPLFDEPAGFVISAIDPELKEVTKLGDGRLSHLSPSMQLLCRFANERNPLFVVDGGRGINPSKYFASKVVTVTETTKESVNAEIDNIDMSVLAVRDVYLNELPENSFDALKNSLKLSTSASNRTRKMNGVTVIFDIENDLSPTHSNGKSDKSCFVNEGLMESTAVRLGSVTVADNGTLNKIPANDAEQVVPSSIEFTDHSMRGPRSRPFESLNSLSGVTRLPITHAMEKIHDERVLKPVDVSKDNTRSPIKLRKRGGLIRDKYFLRIRGNKGLMKWPSSNGQSKRLRSHRSGGGLSDVTKTVFKKVSMTIASKSRVLTRARKTLSSSSSPL